MSGCAPADCEFAFTFRLRQAAAKPNYSVRSVRAWSVAFLQALPPEIFDKTVQHPAFDPMKFRNIVEMIAGHDLNHLAQL